MKAETLKKAILQYAMQGKLVEQNLNDEPASVLLERIKAEKEQLIKDGKIKKEKPLPPISEDEIPYELPKGWEWVRIKDLAVLYNGKAFKPSDWSNEGLPIVRIQNLNNIYAEYNYYNGFVEDTYMLNGGELLFAWSGTPGTSFGAHIWRGGKAVLNQHIFKMVFNETFIYKRFLMYALNQRIEELISKAHGAVGLQHVTKGVFENTPLPLPPLAEQERIVDKLEQILPLVEEYGKNEEKLSKLNSTLPDKIKQSILQHAVQGKLVPQNPDDEPASVLLNRIKAEKEQLIKDGKIKKEKPLPSISEDEIPFEIPNSWEWTKIRNIAFVTKLAGFEYTKYINLQDSGEIPVIRAQNVKPFSLNLTNLKYIDTDTSKMLERSALTRPCLLMTFIGAGIGDVAIFDKNSRFHLAPNVAKIEFYNKNNNNIDNKYAMYYLLSSYGKQEVFKFLKATAQPSLSMDTIREVMIPLPPLAEQQRIVTKVEELLAVIDNLKKG